MAIREFEHVNHRGISEREWAESEREHRGSLEPVVGPSLERRRRGIGHPVYDFLFTYFSYPPGKLLRWHPGIGVEIQPDPDGSRLPEYLKKQPYIRGIHGYTLDASALTPEAIARAEWIGKLCANLADRAGQFGCFGLHEWAMVYRSEEVRHSKVRLRLSEAEIADVVESQPLRCTHFDAYRFFTRSALPLNGYRPGFDTRLQMEQPGCIHTNMDLYKWGYKLLPWCGSDVVREAFLLAVRAREIDMRASPYDLEKLGFTPIRIETAEGRDEYVRHQRGIAEQARGVREKLMDRTRAVLESAGREGAAI